MTVERSSLASRASKKRSGSWILCMTLLVPVLTAPAGAVGAYHPPCEGEQEAEMQSIAAIHECFVKNVTKIRDENFSDICGSLYKKSAEIFKKSRICEMNSSILSK